MKALLKAKLAAAGGPSAAKIIQDLQLHAPSTSIHVGPASSPATASSSSTSANGTLISVTPTTAFLKALHAFANYKQEDLGDLSTRFLTTNDLPSSLLAILANKSLKDTSLPESILADGLPFTVHSICVYTLGRSLYYVTSLELVARISSLMIPYAVALTEETHSFSTITALNCMVSCTSPNAFAHCLSTPENSNITPQSITQANALILLNHSVASYCIEVYALHAQMDTIEDPEAYDIQTSMLLLPNVILSNCAAVNPLHKSLYHEKVLDHTFSLIQYEVDRETLIHASRMIALLFNGLVKASTENETVNPKVEQLYAMLSSHLPNQAYIQALAKHPDSTVSIYASQILKLARTMQNTIKPSSAETLMYDPQLFENRCLEFRNPSVRRVIPKQKGSSVQTNPVPKQTVTSHQIKCGGCFRDQSASDRFLRCSRCLTAAYCSKECQKSDWKRHKPTCQSKT